MKSSSGLPLFFPPKCVDTSEHNSSTAVTLLSAHPPEEFKEIRNSTEQQKCIK